MSAKTLSDTPLGVFLQQESPLFHDRRAAFLSRRFGIQLEAKKNRLRPVDHSNTNADSAELLEYIKAVLQPEQVLVMNGVVISGESFYSAAAKAETDFGIVIEFDKVDGRLIVQGGADQLNAFKSRAHEPFSFAWSYYANVNKEWKAVKDPIFSALNASIFQHSYVEIFENESKIAVDFTAMNILHLSSMTFRSLRFEIAGKSSYIIQNNANQKPTPGLIAMASESVPAFNLPPHIRKICKKNHVSEQTVHLCIQKMGRQPTNEAELLTWVMQHEEDYLNQQNSEKNESNNSGSESDEYGASHYAQGSDDEEEGEDSFKHVPSHRRREESGEIILRRGVIPTSSLPEAFSEYSRASPGKPSGQQLSVQGSNSVRGGRRFHTSRQGHKESFDHSPPRQNRRGFQKENGRNFQQGRGRHTNLYSRRHAPNEQDYDDDFGDDYVAQVSQRLQRNPNDLDVEATGVEERPSDSAETGIPIGPKSHTIFTQFPSLQGKKLRPVVIDGSNVAFSHGLRKAFSSKGLLLAFEYFRPSGVDIFITTPMWRLSVPPEQQKPPLTDKSILEDLYMKGVLVETPSKSYEDHGVVDLAMSWNAVIVSIDAYKDLEREHKVRDYLRRHLITYTFAQDTFLVSRQTGKHGITFEQMMTVSKATK